METCIICDSPIPENYAEWTDHGPLCPDCYEAVQAPDPAELLEMLDEVGVPVDYRGQPLDFEHRVACLVGMYMGTLAEYVALARMR